MEERSNELSQNIDNGGEKLKSDNWAKGLFSLKIVPTHPANATPKSPGT